MTMVGADADALEALGRQMLAGAEVLDRARTLTRSQLHSSPWQGPAASDFRADWDRRHAVALATVASHLRTAAERLARNASEQRTTSNADGNSVYAFTPAQLQQLLKTLALTGNAAQVLASGPGQWLEKFLEIPGLLRDAKGLPIDAVDRLGGVSTTLGGLSLAMFLAQQFAPNGSRVDLALEGASKVFGTASAVVSAISVLRGGAAGGFPALGVVAGAFGMGMDIGSMIDKGVNAEDAVSLGGHLMTTVGSGLMLVPGGQAAGAVLIAGGAAVDLGLWVYKNHEEIGHALSDAGHAVADGAEAVAAATTHAAVEVAEAAAHTVESVGNAAKSVLHGLGGLL